MYQSMYERLQYCVKVQCVTGVDWHSQQNGDLADLFNCDIGTDDFGYTWLAQDVGSRSDFMKLLIDRMNERATLSVLSQVENSPKADHYKHFKN